MTDVTEYLIIWVFTLVSIFAFLIGPMQMVKLILGNYLVMGLLRGFHASVDVLTTWLMSQSWLSFFGMSYDVWAQLVIDGQITIGLLIAISAIVIIFQRSNLTLSFPPDELLQKWLFVVFIPLTVVSVIMTLLVAVVGVGLLDIEVIRQLASNFSPTGLLYDIVVLIPVWLLVHSVITIALITQLRIQYQPGEE